MSTESHCEYNVIQFFINLPTFVLVSRLIQLIHIDIGMIYVHIMYIDDIHT